MLSRLDKGVAVLSWVAAALVVLLLAIGPRLIASEETQPSTGQASDGETVFVENCGTCHTLSAAGTSGQIGPSLDEISLDAAAVETTVEEGPGGMPSFAGTLSSAEIAAVAEFLGGSP